MSCSDLHLPVATPSEVEVALGSCDFGPTFKPHYGGHFKFLKIYIVFNY